jgi:hypothetical protein
MAGQTAAEQADTARLKRELILLEQAELELENVREQTIERKAQKEHKVRRNKLSQAGLAEAVRASRELTNICRHRQGGQNGQVYKGKGLATSLKVEKMPDGFTIRIRCLNCPLRVTSPIPSNASKKLKKGETVEERNARLLKFAADKERFEKFYEMSQEGALTSEAAQPMECGTTFKFLDEDGAQIYKPRPSDSYAMEIAP